MTIDPPEIRTVTTRKVCCDADQGALGHPRVWLHIPHERNWIDCPYCDRRFVFRGEEVATEG